MQPPKIPTPDDRTDESVRQAVIGAIGLCPEYSIKLDGITVFCETAEHVMMLIRLAYAPYNDFDICCNQPQNHVLLGHGEEHVAHPERAAERHDE
jgi:hypothetical protein